LAFEVYSGSIVDRGQRVYVADVENQYIIDTCLMASEGIAWSPTAPLLAMLAPGRNQRPLWVLDVETNSIYTIAYHQAGVEDGVIGWRAGE